MRYIILVALNVPIILLALLNLITQFKLKKISSQRFRHQIIFWGIIFITLIASFPAYNYINARPLLDSSELSLFDIVQTTAIIVMIYVLNRQRLSMEKTEDKLKSLHRELSILLSTKK